MSPPNDQLSSATSYLKVIPATQPSLWSRRSYKPTLTRSEAAAEMELMAGRELDPHLTGDFLRFIKAYG